MGWIPLSKGLWTEVDNANIGWLSQFKWCAKAGGNGSDPYAARTVRVNGEFKTIRMHRLIMDCPEGMEIDHLDNDKLNNKRVNLNICTRAENNKRMWERIKYTKIPHNSL